MESSLGYEDRSSSCRSDDTLYQDVIVLRELGVTGIEDGLFIFIEDDLDEVVEGARVDSGDVA